MSCCEYTKITNIGTEHVVVDTRDLHEMLRRLKVKLSKQLRGELERCGRYLVIDIDTWQVILGVCREALERRGGGCQAFCDEACSGDDGCDDAGGEPGECVAVCGNGEVYLQNPTV